MTNRLRALFVPFLIVVFGIVGAVAASANGSSQTELDITVPSSISLTGLSASYAATIPAGTTGNIDTAVTVSTNNGSGYTLSVAGVLAPSANFLGSGGRQFSWSNDTLQTCSSGFTGCVSKGPLASTGTAMVVTSGTTAGDVIDIRHMISVPAAQAADTYSAIVNYTATANP